MTARRRASSALQTSRFSKNYRPVGRKSAGAQQRRVIRRQVPWACNSGGTVAPGAADDGAKARLFRPTDLTFFQKITGL